MHTTLLHAFERKLRDSKVPATHQARVYNMLKETVTELRNKSRSSRIEASGSAQRLLDQVTRSAGVTGDQLRTDTRGTGLQARLLAMYLLRGKKYSFAEIGHYFERHHSTVVRSVKVVKQRLENGDTITVELFNKYKQNV